MSAGVRTSSSSRQVWPLLLPAEAPASAEPVRLDTATYDMSRLFWAMSEIFWNEVHVTKHNGKCANIVHDLCIDNHTLVHE